MSAKFVVGFPVICQIERCVFYFKRRNALMVGHHSIALRLALAFSMFGLIGLSAGLVPGAQAATKAQISAAEKACRVKFGKKPKSVTFSKNGQIICNYGSGNGGLKTEEQVRAWCKKKYPHAVNFRISKRGGKWLCTYYE